MVTLTKWSWPRSLALTDAGRTVQVDEILFGTIREHCQALGIHEGSVLTCLGQDELGVKLKLPTGRSARMPRDYAWFVSVNGV